ncbi:MAG: hypothetical protein MJY56_04765, partial [Bacteroidales bacterium]|nr:hypothetical protein [Bacteroidales bacterium]
MIKNRMLLVAAALLALAACTPEDKPGKKEPEPTEPTMKFKNAPVFEVAENSTGVALRGLGVELDPHFLSQNVTRNDGATAADWKNIVCKRCKMMDVDRFRVFVLPHWWEPDNDNNDPDSYNWDAFTFDNTEMKSLYAVLDLAEEMGTDVTLVLWGCHTSASTLDGGYIGRHFLANGGNGWVTGTKDNAEFAECFVGLAKYLVETKGYTCIKELTPYNEPNGNVASINDYIATAKALDAKLKAEGLRDKIQLNLSDNHDGGYSFLQSCCSNLKNQADFFNSHTYIFGYETTNKTVVDWERKNVEAAASAGKDHFVGEFGSNQCVGATRQTDISTYERGILMTRHVCNFLNAGACGASYWSLIDQYYGKNESYGQMQQLGLWIYMTNAYGAQELGDFTEDYECRPQYYAYSMLTRFIKKGSHVYPIDFGHDFITGTAVRSDQAKWTYVIANPEKEILYYRLKNDHSGGNRKLNYYVYQKGKLPTGDAMIEASDELKPIAGTYEVRVPALSVIVL